MNGVTCAVNRFVSDMNAFMTDMSAVTRDVNAFTSLSNAFIGNVEAFVSDVNAFMCEVNALATGVKADAWRRIDANDGSPVALGRPPWRLSICSLAKRKRRRTNGKSRSTG
jgi:hypothetical protein